MTKQWQSIALLAGAIVVFGCATMSTVKTYRAPQLPSAIAAEIDTSCHIADTVRIWIDTVLVSARVMRPHDAFELPVAAGVHTLAARSVPTAFGKVWTWPMTVVTIAASERYTGVLRCPAAQTDPIGAFPQRILR